MLAGDFTEQEATTETLYDQLPSEDEHDNEFVDGDEMQSEDELDEVPAEEVTALAIETIQIVKPASRMEYRSFANMDLPDEEDSEFVESESEAEDEEEPNPMDIESEEVKDNIIYSNLDATKAPNLLKNAKVLRDGREINTVEIVDLSERIQYLLSEQ